MKKTIIALTLTLTAILFAGCSTITALPLEDNTVSEAVTSSPIPSITPEPAPISSSGSKESDMISDEESVIPEAEDTSTRSDVETEIKEQSDSSESEKADDEKASVIQTKEPQSTPKPIASAELEIRIPSEETEEQPVPVPTSAITVEPSPEPADPATTPTPQPELKVMGGDFNNAVLAAVNEARADYGNAPMTLDSGLCEKAVAHAKEMAKRGERFHSCGGAESVSDSSSSARTIGIRSAVHASGLALDANRSRLGVGSVKIGDKQYTCVFSPQD